MPLLRAAFQPRRSAALRFEVAGQLLQREVEPGMTVATGDTLLILDDRDLKDQERTAEAELRLEESGIERDRIRLEQAVRHRELQREEVARHMRLGKRSLLSQSSLNAAEQKTHRTGIAGGRTHAFGQHG